MRARCDLHEGVAHRFERAHVPQAPIDGVDRLQLHREAGIIVLVPVRHKPVFRLTIRGCLLGSLLPDINRLTECRLANAGPVLLDSADTCTIWRQYITDTTLHTLWLGAQFG
jgi:hypothetical protein